MAEEQNNASQSLDPKDKGRRPHRVRVFLIGVIIMSAIAGFNVTFQRHQYIFHDSALLYIGVPLLFAFLLAMSDKSQTAMGATMKGITIGLLLSAPILQEGFLCILFAAPIFFAVGAIVAAIIDSARAKRRNNKQVLSHPVVLGLMVMSLEGTIDPLSFPRDQVVTAEKIVAATPVDIERQLAQPMELTRDIPLVSRIFPQPEWNVGEGLNLGDERRSHLVYRKHIWFNHKVGDTVFRVTERSPNHAVFSLVEDTSYISNYLRWKTSTVRWEPVDAAHTRVTWELRFDRKLDPAWYFTPIERYFVGLAGEAFINNLATPTS